jgi:hypothetical protein
MSVLVLRVARSIDYLDAVLAFNPYWDVTGLTFEDPTGIG